MSITDRFSVLHERLVLRHPIAVLVISAITVTIFGWYAQDFGLDASADSLTLEHDESLSYYRTVGARYGSDDYLIVTFSPEDNLFSDPVLRRLHNLRSELNALDNVESVVSILDVPLIKSPPVNLKQISKGVRYLQDDSTDREMARAELVGSSLYRDLLISADARTTALRVNLLEDKKYLELRELRDQLREKSDSADFTAEDAEDLASASSQFDKLNQNELAREEQTLSDIRNILDRYQDVASLHLSLIHI